jgi:hypothetical protein
VEVTLRKDRAVDTSVCGCESVWVRGVVCGHLSECGRARGDDTTLQSGDREDGAHVHTHIHKHE